MIGGSLAAALRRRNLFSSIIGYGRDAGRLQAAVDRGLLDGGVMSPTDIPADTALVVVCTPVTRIAADVRTLRPYLSEAAIITDAGSTKRHLCEALADYADAAPCFVGSHPIAGSEKQGFEYADAELFNGRTCVITPLPGHSEATLLRVEQFWQAIGMQTRRLTPAEHDRALARTSHVPHVVAAAVAGVLSPSDLVWTGSGFRDTTRIAAGDPGLWTTILQENAAEVQAGLAAVRELLAAYEQALASKDTAAIHRLLESAKQIRDSVSEPSP